MLDVDAIDYGVTQKLIGEISSPIGYVVLNWAFIEQYFSSIIESTFDAASAAGLRPERPRQFEAKKDQLEKIFAGLNELEEFRKHWSVALGVIGTITPVSHAYAHGTIGRFEDGIITFFKVNPAKTKDGHTVSEVTISLDNIQKAADVIGELSNHLGDLASRVVDHMEALGRT